MVFMQSSSTIFIKGAFLQDDTIRSSMQNGSKCWTTKKLEDTKVQVRKMRILRCEKKVAGMII